MNTPQWKQFMDGIGLPDRIKRRLEAMDVPEEKWKEWEQAFYQDKEKCYALLQEETPYRLFVLAFCCHMAIRKRNWYRQQGIREKIYWDTFSDIRIWAENCERDYGEIGLHPFFWIARHLEGSLFRLGRLQFEITTAEKELPQVGIKKEAPIFCVHIPQGEKLGYAEVCQSFAYAQDFWRKDLPYLCYSWLLYPKLREILPQESNILAFQSLFEIIEVNEEERQAEERIFGKPLENREDYPEKTSLQRNAKKYLLSGNALGNGRGIFCPDRIRTGNPHC